MARQSQIPRVQMQLQRNHQVVFDACVTSGPLIDIIKQSNQLLKDRADGSGIGKLSPGEVQRILSSLRVLGLIAQTENGTWFAPVTPAEEKLVEELNKKHYADWKAAQS